MIKKIHLILISFIIFSAFLGLYSTVLSAESEFRYLVDSRGVKVRLPKEIKRVITISDGLIEGVMIILGEQKKLVALGAQGFGTTHSYSYPSSNGGQVTYKNGMKTVSVLDDRLKTLPLIATWNTMPNYEKIAALNPDVIIIRAGSCWHFMNDEQVPKSIAMIESLGFPVVVLRSPNAHEQPKISIFSDEIRLIGKVFGKEAQAGEIADYLMHQAGQVIEMTRHIPENEKPKLLIIGLSPRARENGAAGNVICRDNIESFFLEKVVNAHNACQEKGGRRILSAEHILLMDPDAIVLRTSYGYHPPEELYNAPYYENLRELKAVKNRRIFALPWNPCNCDKRLEYPIDIMVMAKAAYPERFAHIDLTAWLIDFYQGLYGVDKKTAEKLRSVQWMDWTVPLSTHSSTAP